MAKTKGQCLVLTAFDEEGSVARQHSDDIMEGLIKPAAAALGYEAFRIIDKPALGEILDQVLRAIKRSNFVIFDLSYINRNVDIELACVLGTQKPHIVITNDIASLGFYMSTRFAVKIRSEGFVETDKTRQEFTGLIRALEQGHHNPENFIYRYLRDHFKIELEDEDSDPSPIGERPFRLASEEDTILGGARECDSDFRWCGTSRELRAYRVIETRNKTGSDPTN